MGMPAQEGNPLSPVQQALTDYIRNGLSVLPCSPRDKNPNFTLLPKDDSGKGTWRPYQVQLPTQVETQEWTRADPSTNIGIICGVISGGLVVWDVDHEPLARWLEENAQALIQKTWVVRTGSGKLHLYFRSKRQVFTQVVKNPVNGDRLGELRGDGRDDRKASYVLAPPSTHPSGGSYVTITGGPDSILLVDDVESVVGKVLKIYSGQAGGTSAASSPPASMNIRVPLVGDEAQALTQKLNLHLDKKTETHKRRVLRAILRGANAQSGEWSTYPSDSEIDYAVVSELRKAGFSLEEIECVYATFPIGENCYRNTKRSGSYGSRYITTTVESVDRNLKAMREAALLTAGENFTILKAVRFQSAEAPYVKLTIRNHATGQDDEAVLTWQEMMTERSFRENIGRQCPRLFPRLKDVHSGRGFLQFIESVLLMCDVEPVPMEATNIGHIIGMIAEILSSPRRILSHTPNTSAEFTLGWRDNAKQVVYVRGKALVSEILILTKLPVTPGKIWEVMQYMGAEELRIKVGTGTERLWVVPLSAITK